jgi:hypothetical protein
MLFMATGLGGQESIRWTRNGIPIPNETNDTLVVTSPGIYGVTVFYSNCASIIRLAKQVSLAFVDCSALGIPQPTDNIFAILYPNPTSGIISMTGSKNIYTVEIYDLLGQNVFSATYGGEQRVTIDLSTYAKGMYSVKINHGQGYLPGKIVIE